MEQRLFLAIKFGIDHTLKNIYFRLKKALARERVKFYPLEELMLILRYLGDVPVEFLPDINRQIAPVISSSPGFALKITGVDIYPYDIMPRVLWFRVEQEERLMSLAQNLEHTIQQFTGHQEDFAFYPHVTFARIRFLKNMQALDMVKQYQNIEPVSFAVNQIILYEKQESPEGNIYRVRNRFDLLGKEKL